MKHNPNRYSLHVNYLLVFLNTNCLLFFRNTNCTNYTNKLLENERFVRFERFVFKNQLRMKDS